MADGEHDDGLFDDLQAFAEMSDIAGIDAMYAQDPNASVPPTFVSAETRKRSREDVPMCDKCTSTKVTLRTGGTRGLRYVYVCDLCDYRWSQLRAEHPILGWDKRESKIAVGDEPRRSGGYACGVCGVRPKKGHVCTGGSATAMTSDNGDDDDADDADDFGMPPILAMPARLPVPNDAPLGAVQPQAHADDDDGSGLCDFPLASATVAAANAVDMLVAADASLSAIKSTADDAMDAAAPLATTDEAVIAFDEPTVDETAALVDAVPSHDEAVARSDSAAADEHTAEPPDLSAAEEAAAPDQSAAEEAAAPDQSAADEASKAPVETTLDDTATATVDAAEEAPTAADKNVEPTDKAAETLRTTAADAASIPAAGDLPPPSLDDDASQWTPAIQSFKSDSTVATDMRQSMTPMKTTSDVAAASGEASVPVAPKPLPLITARQGMKQLKLTRLLVRGDGSCWAYAVLATVGLCEHAHADTEGTPSLLDRARDGLLREKCKAWLQEHAETLQLSAQDKTDAANLHKQPSYPLRRRSDFGTFGNGSTLQALAAFLKVTIVTWNRSTCGTGSETHLQQAFVYDEETDSTGHFTLAPREIVVMDRLHPRKVVHIEFNGVDHYNALVAPMRVIANPPSVNLLMKLRATTVASPIGRRFKTEAGWSVYANMVVFDDETNVTIVPSALPTTTSTKKLTDMCLRDGFQGFILNYDQKHIKFIRLNQPFTAAWQLQAADCTTALYIHTAVLAALAERDPVVKPCVCMRYFAQQMTEMNCCACGRWCHLTCLDLPTLDLEELHDYKYTCPDCA